MNFDSERIWVKADTVLRTEMNRQNWHNWHDTDLPLAKAEGADETDYGIRDVFSWIKWSFLCRHGV